MSSTLAGGRAPRVSWSAILAGVVLVVAIEAVLALAGLAAGLGAIHPGHADSAAASRLGVGAAIWWLLSSVLALLAGCAAAARMAGVATRSDGVLHGLVVWGVALLLTLTLLGSAIGRLAGSAFSAVSGLASAAAGTTSAAVGTASKLLPSVPQATGVTPDIVRKEADELLESGSPPADPAAMSEADAAKAIAGDIPDLAAGGLRGDQARARIKAVVAARAHVTPEEADARIGRVEAELTRIRDKAAEVATDTADAGAGAASRASLLAAVGLLIGAAASGLGGSLVVPRETDPARRR